MALGRVSNFMASAGEVLGLTEDPLHTALGVKLVEATSEELVTENWEVNLIICDIINQTEAGPGQAVRAVRKRLEQCAGHSNKSTVLTLTVLETAAKNCRKSFLRLVCEKEFVDFLISRVISPHLDPGPEVQTKVLSLIQSWAHAFSPDPELRGVAEVYMDLKKKGIQFPIPSDEDLLLVQSMQPSPTRSEKSVSSSSSTGQNIKPAPPPPAVTQEHHKKLSRGSFVSVGRLTERQLKKLRRDIEITERHLEVFSELLSEVVPGQEHPEDVSLLTEVGRTSQEMQGRIMELVSILQDRQIIAQLLDINDKINNEMLRYERYLSKCKKLGHGKKDPEAFSPDEVLLQLPPTSSTSSRPLSQGSSQSVKTGKEEDFQEIEAWMKENEGNESLLREFEEENTGEEATSQEFDSFLRKRAEAAQKRD